MIPLSHMQNDVSLATEEILSSLSSISLFCYLLVKNEIDNLSLSFIDVVRVNQNF